MARLDGFLATMLKKYQQVSTAVDFSDNLANPGNPAIQWKSHYRRAIIISVG